MVDVEEDAPHLFEVGAAAAVEADAASAADKELGSQIVFEQTDAVGDGGSSDAELVCGAGEALVPCGGLEEAQAVEGREGFHRIVGVV